MAQKNTEENNISTDSDNIFDEFTNSDDIKEEISKKEKQQQRDMYYYIKKSGSFFFTINIILFIVLIVGAFYIYIQEGEWKKEYRFLSSVCNIFLWSTNITPGTCYGVSPILWEYENLLSNNIDSQARKIFPILWDIYSIENFNLSRKVSFLLEKSDTRLKPLEILVAFDNIKNIFSPTDKEEISCYDMFISDNMLNITCDAYSSDWNTDIVTLNQGAIETLPWGGTSISRASSFIYFIENYHNSSFVILEKPQTLSYLPIQLWPYTQKTTFTLKMEYTSKKDLIF